MTARWAFMPYVLAVMMAGVVAPAQNNVVRGEERVLPETTTEGTSSQAPVAFVYVTGTVNNQYKFQIHGFAASGDGRLTPLPGSPFQDDVMNMAVNGKYLFGANTDGIPIDSLTIAGNGVLHKVASTEDDRHAGGNCDVVGPLFLDHTGATLYNLESGTGRRDHSSWPLTLPMGMEI